MRITKSIHSEQQYGYKDWALAFTGTTIGFAFLFLTFYPGMRDGDTIALIWYINQGFFSTYQSPLLGILWKYPFLIGGTPAIHAVQCLLVAFSTSFFVGQLLGSRWLVFVVPAILASPTVGPYAGTLVKDVWFSSIYLICLTCYWRYFITNRFYWILLFMIFLAVSIHIRPNGIFAILPVVLLHFKRLLNSKTSRSLNFSLLALTSLVPIVGLLIITPVLKNYYRIVDRPAEQVIFLADLSGLSLRTGEWLIPEEFNPFNIKFDRLEDIYSPAAANQLFAWSPRDKNRVLIVEDNPEALELLREVWVSSVIKYPLDYFHIRWESFSYFVGLKGLPGWFYQKTTPPIENEPDFEKNGISKIYLGVADWIEIHTYFSMLWPYLLISIFAIPIFWYLIHSTALLPIILALTGVSYGICFGLISVHAGYRYYWPTAFYSTVLVLVIFALCFNKIIKNHPFKCLVRLS